LGSDNWPVTWALDGSQYTSWGDGGGFGGTEELGRTSLGFARVEGALQNYRGVNVLGGVGGVPSTLEGKSYGMVAVGDALYAWVSPGSGATNFSRASLLRSVDGGIGWEFTGVEVTSEADGVALPAILNFGPGYRGARDDYLYHYFVDVIDATALEVQRPGRFSLARSPRGELHRRSSYEWFAGVDTTGMPRWTPDLDERAAVFEDPHGVGWNLSVSYNSGLRRYLLATEHDRTSASNLGVFEAPEPWGPWRVVHYENGWGSGEVEQTVFYWNFANRWLSRDGHEFVIVFSGTGQNDSWNTVAGRFVLSER
jgi:hypothetical protein